MLGIALKSCLSMHASPFVGKTGLEPVLVIGGLPCSKTYRSKFFSLLHYLPI